MITNINFDMMLKKGEFTKKSSWKKTIRGEWVDVLEKLTDSIKILNEVDEYKDSLVDRLSEQDKKLSDLLHYIENNKLSTAQCYRIVKEIKKQREIRRKIKNDMNILSTYDKHINKLLNTNNRSMLLAELYKVDKRLQAEYKNRLYTEEEINEILGV